MSTSEPRVVFAARRKLFGWRDKALAEPAHDAKTASILGLALGVSFAMCFATGLWSHVAQDPDSWITFPTGPEWGYRFTQGLHVISGTASIPLLLAKLWAVYPHLFDPVIGKAGPILERLSLVPLVAGSLFMLFTGWVNITRWYPWEFFFPHAHYWVSWITMGALIIHIGAKISTARTALTTTALTDTALTTALDAPAPCTPDGEMSAGAPCTADDEGVVVTRHGPSRRSVLWWAFGSSAALTLVTAGQTVTWFRKTVLFAPRRGDINLQGLPVNQTAGGAGVVQSANDPNWKLSVTHRGRTLMQFDVVQLAALPQRTTTLPIACVEGWSASASWTGVSMADLLYSAGAPTGREIRVTSLEQGGLYSSSVVNSDLAAHPDTLLALKINGEPLHLDHGYPVRLIAPNRPGVLQTKWLAFLDVQ